MKPNTLLNRVLRARYGDVLWNGIYRNNPSSTWKIIQNGADFLFPVLRWSISNGEYVDTFKDIWILDKTLDKWSTFVSIIENNYNKVSDFITNGSWDIDKLKFCFGKLLIDLILSIPIHSSQPEDKMECIKKISGKSVAAIIYEKKFNAISEDETYKWRKKLKLKPKIDMFWWRISKNSIPTFALLSYRRLINHEGCPRGCLDTENTDHIVRRCFFINKVFKLLEEWNFGTPEFDSVEDCYQVLSRLANINPFLGNLICSVIFYCYKSRNQLIHGGCDDSCYVIAYRAVIQSISSFKNGLIRENWNANQLFKLSKSSWLPPPLGWIKVNVDASIFLNNSTGIEGIFRDYKGRGLAAFGFHTIHWDIAQKELLAILSLRDLIKDWMLEAKGEMIILNAEDLKKNGLVGDRAMT
ncbi:uncharacterized protein LOC110096170 [Dendrobium catenatum]|uniref:uncharacterized protein LOC110096170 n=1 Tax=Dendrobium catenatum TaxID=906689 RepID=UPI0009F5AD39|nr:uncharacterized protein LOC110096170 [Dendrobium catenatum]